MLAYFQIQPLSFSVFLRQRRQIECDIGQVDALVVGKRSAVRSPDSNLFSEIVRTFVLVFAVLYFVPGGEVAVRGETIPVGMGSIGALPVGLPILSIGMSLGGTTGCAINPARDLGPRIAHALLPIPGKGSSDRGYAWIPVVGPLVGSVLVAVLEMTLGS